MSNSKTSLAKADAATLTDGQPDEIDAIARKMAADYRSMAVYFQKEMGLSASEAGQRARTPNETEFERVSESPNDQISWWDLSLLAEQSDVNATAIWERIKQAARDELSSGHRAGEVVECHLHSRPFQRARFLAIRQAFIEEWKPRGGIEQALIDSMAQTYFSYLNWLGIHTTHSEIEAEKENDYYQRRGKRKERPEYKLMHLEQSFQMAERFNRLFLRTLRQLRDLRRYSAPVTINNPKQVNIATDGGQQVNSVEGMAR